MLLLRQAFRTILRNQTHPKNLSLDHMRDNGPKRNSSGLILRVNNSYITCSEQYRAKVDPEKTRAI